MTDTVSKTKRSWMMGRVRGRDTQPELVVRRLAHSLGYRFRLHRRDLPGNPDLVFPRLKKVIFVHGCFWHGHDCPRGKRPSTNIDFWTKKLDRNIERDQKSVSQLEQLGWSVLTIWECEISDVSALADRLRQFLEE